MPRARHRLDLLLIPRDPERVLERTKWDSLMARWERMGVLQEERPGASAEHLIRGGFDRLWLDQPGGIRLFANQQGGYRVHCPDCGSLITGAFVPALGAWRRGGERRMDCPECEASPSLESLDFRPRAGFAAWALVVSDVRSLELEQSFLDQAEAALGPLQTVLQRVG